MGQPGSCLLCRSPSHKVIYFGFPMRLCSDIRCSCLFGFWERVTRYLPFNGMFFVYHGSYLPALWLWLTRRSLP